MAGRQRGQWIACGATVALALLSTGCLRVGFGWFQGDDGGGAEDQTVRESGTAGGDSSSPDVAGGDGPLSDSGDGPLSDSLLPFADLFPQQGDADVGPILDLALWPDWSNALVADANHDNCNNPLVVDLAGLGSGSIDITIDTAGAVADYSVGVCSHSDVVVLIQNAPTSLWWDCLSGSGGFTMGEITDLTCNQPVGNITMTSCGGGNEMSQPPPASTYILVFCRDTALGPATLRLYGAQP